MDKGAVWLGLGVWGLTLASGAILGFGAGLNNASSTRTQWTTTLGWRITDEVLFGDPPPDRERRLLAWLQAVGPESTIQHWANGELSNLSDPPPPAREKESQADVAAVDVTELGPVEFDRNPTVDEAACDLPIAAVASTSPQLPPPLAIAAVIHPPAVAIVPAKVVIPPVVVPIVALPEVPPEIKPIQGRLVVGEVDVFAVTAPSDARREVLRRIDGWKKCYEVALAQQPTLTGLIELSWRVADGLVSDVTTTLDTVGNADVATCARENLLSWSFPADVAGPMSVPVHLRPAPIGG